MSYRREGEFNYTIHPGEGLCTIDEIVSVLRVCNRKEALSILADLQRRHLISFNILSNGCCVKYRIHGWRRFNRVHKNTAHCHKKSDFFFISTTLVSEIIGTRQASEMDILFDLWINAVYADDRVQGSVVGPVVYMRNGSGNPRVSYEVLAKRWNVSKATVGRYFKKLVALEYISLTTLPEKQGIVIYLENCLSTMFRVSDILLDKEEIVMQIKTKITFDDSVVKADISASAQCFDKVIQKLENILVAHGYSCVGCRGWEYKLSKLPESEELLAMHSSSKSQAKLRYHLVLSCRSDKQIMVFELTFRPVIQSKGGIVNDSQEQS